MKKFHVLVLLTALMMTTNVFAVFSNAYVSTTTDNNRFEMIHFSYGACSYNLKFDKWTGNIGVITKNGVTLVAKDANSELEAQNQECTYQLIKGNEDSVEHCYILNTKTGELWEANFKGGKYCTIEKL